MMNTDIRLKCHTSITKTAITFQLDGLDDIEHLAIRSEGKLRTKLISNEFQIRIDNDFFGATDFNSGHLSGDRLCLALLIVFTPTFTAISSDKVQRDYFNINDFQEFDNVYLDVDFEVSDSLKHLFKKTWLFPKLSIETTSINPDLTNDFNPNPRTSLAWGGGLDSTASVLIYDEFPNCDYYYLDSVENEKAKNFSSVYGYNVPTVITNCKHIYSDGGFPNWVAPILPAILRGDSICFLGTTMSTMISDGFIYRYNRNLWLDASNICGMIQCTAHCISEYSASELVYNAGLSRFICGINCSEWGVSYKALRKALYMASLDESFYPDVEFFESKGLVIDFDNPFSERSKFSMDIVESAIRLQDKNIRFKSIDSISDKISSFQQSWNLKAPLSTSLPFIGYTPNHVLEYLEIKFSNLGIPIMSESDLENFKSYDYMKIVQSSK